MTCPTCSHTLELFCQDAAQVYHYHCPRCGTTVSIPRGPEQADVVVPKLVERCRMFEENMAILAPQWRGLGIAESINKPEDRRPA